MLPLFRTLFSFSHIYIFTSFTICNKIFFARKILLYPPPPPLTLCALCASCFAILRKIILAWSLSSFKIRIKRWKSVQLAFQCVTLFPLSVLLSYGISVVQTSPSQGWLNLFLFYPQPATVATLIGFSQAPLFEPCFISFCCHYMPDTVYVISINPHLSRHSEIISY